MPCANECHPNSTNCVSPMNLPANLSVLEYCLDSGHRLTGQCNVSYSHREHIWKPCEHCLLEGCAWEDGECRDGCENGTNDKCKTVLDLIGSQPVEERVSSLCQMLDNSTDICDPVSLKPATVSPSSSSSSMSTLGLLGATVTILGLLC